MALSVVVKARFSAELAGALDEVCAREGRDRSWVLRRAVEAYVSTEGSAAPARSSRPTAARGGYASPPEPVTALPALPDGPAPGARSVAPARADYPKGQGGDLRYNRALRAWEASR